MKNENNKPTDPTDDWWAYDTDDWWAYEMEQDALHYLAESKENEEEDPEE